MKNAWLESLKKRRRETSRPDMLAYGHVHIHIPAGTNVPLGRSAHKWKLTDVQTPGKGYSIIYYCTIHSDEKTCSCAVLPVMYPEAKVEDSGPRVHSYGDTPCSQSHTHPQSHEHAWFRVAMETAGHARQVHTGTVITVAFTETSRISLV